MRGLLAGWLREHGVDTPLTHNSGGPTMNANFLEIVEALGNKTFLLGSDHYYNLDQSWPQNNPTPQYAANIFASLEMLRLMGYPPTVHGNALRAAPRIGRPSPPGIARRAIGPTWLLG